MPKVMPNGKIMLEMPHIHFLVMVYVEEIKIIGVETLSDHTQHLKNLSKKEREAKFNRLFDIYKKNFKKPIHNHTINEIDFILKTKYLAKEIKDDNYLGLIGDEMVNIDNIVKMYRIDNPNILESLYTEQEKIQQKEDDNMYYPDFVERHINIVLESTDGKYVSGYTTQNAPIRISSLLFILIGTELKDEDCNIDDLWFQDYLASLELAGYIKDE